MPRNKGLRASLFLVPFLCQPAQAVLHEDDLVLWYTFETVTATDVPDQSANQLDATIHGDPVLVDAQYGKAMEFDGTDDRLSLAYTPLLALPEYTVSIWMKSQKSNDNYTGIFGRSGRHYALYIVPGHTDAPWAVHNRFRDGGNGNDGPPNLGAGQHGEWTLLTVTKDMSKCSTYINGQFLGSGNVDYPYYGDRTNLNIAANPDNGNGQNYVGQMDDLRLYQIAFSEDEVGYLYSDGNGDWDDLPSLTLNGDALVRIDQGATFTDPGVTATDTEDGALTPQVTITPPPSVQRPPVAWWKFEDDSTDSSAHGNDATLVGDAAYGAGKFGKALVLDGTGDRAEVAAITGFSSDKAVSISAWVNVNTLATDGGIFTTTSNITTLFWINEDAASGEDPGPPIETSLSMNVGDSGLSNRVNGPSGRIFNGEWHHVVGVMDGSTRKIYIDGILEATFNNAVATVHTIEGKLAMIGGWDGSANFDFDGSIDDLRVYDYALSPEKITKLHTWDGSEDLETYPSTVDTSILGDWHIQYEVEDSHGYRLSTERTLRVQDPLAPVLTLVGNAEVPVDIGGTYTEEEASAADSNGGAITDPAIVISGDTVDTNTPGTYTVQYDFTDGNSRAAEPIFRTVTVRDLTPPQITLVGEASVKHPMGVPYKDLGATATDTIDGDILPLSSLYEWNKLTAKGFRDGRNDAGLDFSGNGGFLTKTPDGEGEVTGEIYYLVDADVHALDAGIPPDQPDNYHLLIEGVFRAPVQGTYRFGVEWPNERASFFLDADMDGVYETTGANGTEWMNQGIRYGYTYVDLKPGYYNVAIGFTEGGGGIGLRPRFEYPNSIRLNSLDYVNPSSPLQSNFWAIEKPIDTSVPGTHTITYTATDAAGNTTTATRTVIVEDITDPPVILLTGRPILKHPQGTDYTDEGVTLADEDGNALDQAEVDKVKVLGAVDKETTGEYTLTYLYTDSSGRPAEPVSRTIFVVDLSPPTIELLGDPSIEHIAGTTFTDPGLTVTDSIDPAPIWGSTANIPTESLFLHVDASAIPGAQEGDVINIWPDTSPSQNHMEDVRGDPSWHASQLNTEPAVYLDGDDYIAALIQVQRQYSIYTVSRLDGNRNGRLIGSRDINWFLGYWGGSEDVFHPEAFATGSLAAATTDPHLYSAISTGSNHVDMWADGVNVVNNHTRNGRVGKLQFGGHSATSESASGYVSEVLLYETAHTPEQLLSIETYLASKYHFYGAPEYERPLLGVPGTYTILYSALDATGNRSFATRELVVKPDPTLPIIQLVGDAQYHQEAGQAYVEPGATLVDVDGNPLAGDITFAGDVVDENRPGVYLRTYDHKTADDRDSIQVVREVVVADTTGPVISLTGDPVIQITPGTPFTDPGVEALDFEGIKPVGMKHDIPVVDWVPGLLGGKIIRRNDWITPNPGNMGIDPLGSSMGEIRSAADPWGTNITVVYSGQIYDEDGEVTLMGNIDDDFKLFIAGTEILYGRGWNNSASTKRSLGAGDNGWHDFEVRMSNGGGPGGLADGNLPGIGVDKTGVAATKTNVQDHPDKALFEVAKNADEFTMDLFRVQGPDYTKFDTTNPGTYIISYTSEDSLGHVSTKERTLIIREDVTQPVLVLYGDLNVTIEAHPTDNYLDPKAKAVSADGSTVLQDNIVADTTVDLSKPGIYTLTYDYEDAQGNFIDPAVRTVTVVDNNPPTISLTGSEFLTVHTGTDFQDPGFAANDAIDGDITAYSSLGVVPGHLQHRIYLEPTANPSHLDMEDTAISLFFKEPVDTVYLGHGPQGDGLVFRDDNDFRKLQAINQWDHYQSFFYGTFHAPKDGDYTFRSEFTDNGTATWLDRDQDGVLSQNGLLGTERMTWQNSVTTVFLAKGDYPIYFGHREETGGSSLKFSITLPDGAEETVHPAKQSPLWSTPALSPPDTSKPGNHQIYYFAKDSSGNWAYAQRTISVIENPNRPVITMLGDPELTIEAGASYQDAGVLLETALGAPIEEDAVVTNIPDGTQAGEFVITYNYTDGDGNKAVPVTRLVHVVDTIAPAITLAGANPANHSVNTPYADPGATVSDAGNPNLPYITAAQFPTDGLVLHLDAAFFKGALNDGDVITSGWEDQSSLARHADIIKGDPTWVEASPEHGLPTVHFDGDDMLTTTHNFEPELDFYTIFTVARYTTTTNRGRVISSVNRNWIFGFHNNGIRRWHSDGWLYNHGPVNAFFHVHAGDVNDLSEANFWVDNVQYTHRQKGLYITRYMPRQIALGGYNTGSEMSKCDISEVILYDRILTQLENTAIRLHLHNKYSVPGTSLQFQFAQLDTSAIGMQELQYLSVDPAGNASTATRTINVLDPADLPLILLTGDAEVEHDSGTPYTDAGATVEGDSAAQVTVANPVDVDNPGTYTVSYDYTDAQSRAAITVTRKVTVVDVTPPVITLTGGETYEHQLGNDWVEPGVIAVDNADGEVVVTDSILTKNQFLRRGYIVSGANDNILNFDQNAGLIVQPMTGEAPLRTAINFTNDAQFRDADPKRPHDVGINQDDHYQNLFLAQFYCKLDGARYLFGAEGPDDRISFWIDLDQDGVFELDGDLGSEFLNPNYYYGYREVQLNKGYYNVAIGHMEYGGGSRVQPRMKAVVGPGPSTLSFIDPSDPLQDGLWVQYNPVGTLTPGEYQITYTATDSAGNTSTATRTVVVRTNPDAPILELTGEATITLNYGDAYVEPGYTAKDIDGNPLNTASATVTGEINPNKLGRQILLYNFSHNGHAARTLKRTVYVVDIAKPQINLLGETTMEVFQGSVFEDPGATATDNYDSNVIAASSENFPADGLLLHLDASSILGRQNGDMVALWPDLSGNDNHFTKTKGTPRYRPDSLAGKAAIYLDGDSLLTSPTSFGRHYTLLMVAKADGLNSGRLISSQDQNYIGGYYNWWGRGQRVDTFHPGGWATNYDKLHNGEINLYTSTTTGANDFKAYSNGRDITVWSNRNGDLGALQFGGYQSGIEMASGYIGEAILYNRILSGEERQGLEARMNAKYLLDPEIPEGTTVPVDTSTLGTYHVVYRVPDSKGNIAVAIRTVNVVPDPNAPVITLVGNAEITHEAGSPFTDPGHTLKDGEDTLDADLVTITGSVDTSVPGVYEIVYSYKPYKKAHAADVSRLVTVVDTTPPTITLEGDTNIRIKVGTPFVEGNFSATDGNDGPIAVASNLNHKWNWLSVDGFTLDRDDKVLDFDTDDSLFLQTPEGQSEFSGDLGGLSGDNDFRDLFTPRLTKWDDYQVNFHGIFAAREAGEYTFGVTAADNRSAFWIDLDQDGIFERDGDKGDERMTLNYTNGTSKTILEVGEYRVAIAFIEHTGGAWFAPVVALPEEPSRSVNTQDPVQANHWAIPLDTPIVDINTAGTYTITYTSTDKAGNTATATRTVVVVEDDTVPFIALKGDAEMTHEFGTAFTDPGVKVTDSAGQPLEDGKVADNTVDVNVLGETTLVYTHSNAVPVTRKVTVVDTTPPAVTLVGEDPLTLTVGDLYTDPGITMTDAADDAPHFTTSELHIPNQLDVWGHNINPSTDQRIDFNNNGNILSQIPDGHALFTNGPNGDGTHFTEESDFHKLFAGISSTDHFQLAFTGYIYARVDGDYTFEVRNLNDRACIWIDLDQDGTFSRNGANGDERVVWHVASGTRSLVSGFYKFAMGYVEFTGSAHAEYLFKAPAGAGPTELTYIQPGAPEQRGIWFSGGTGEVDASKPGQYDITYYALDASGNHTSTATRKVIVEVDQTAPVMTLLGDAEFLHEAATPFTDPGVDLKKADGTPITDPPLTDVTLNGQVVANVDPAVLGTYTISYTYTDGDGKSAIPNSRTVIVQDTVPPVITIAGDNPAIAIPNSFYTDAGATAADALDGDVTVTVSSSNPIFETVPGLVGGNFPGWDIFKANPKNLGVDSLGPEEAQINTSAAPWTGNVTVMYSGEFYDEDGIVSFREAIDEWARLVIDGKVLFDDHDYNAEIEHAADLGRGGWFSFELRMRNTGGGGGAKTPGAGFQYDPAGGTAWRVAENSDAGTADLFRVTVGIPDSINTTTEGEYSITYTATDAAGNTSELTRTVSVKDDPTLPFITLAGEEFITLEAGTAFIDPGSSVADRRGEPLPGDITITGSVDHTALGTYELLYDFTTQDGTKSAPRMRRAVTVVDTTPPEITLNGDMDFRVPINGTWTDPGFTATDNLDATVNVGVVLEQTGLKPVVHWEFNETDGTVAKDLVASLDGTLVNFPDPVADSWVPGKYGNALSFNSANSSYISLPGTTLLDLEGFTISVWLKTDDYKRNMFIFEKTTNDTINSQYNLHFDDSDELNFRINDGAGNFEDLTIQPSAELLPDVWQHLAVVYDSSIQQIYVEGELLAEFQQDVIIPSTPAAGPSYIGAFAPGDGYYFHGLIDDLKVYGQEITQAQLPDIQKQSGVDTSLKSSVPYVFTYSATDSSGNTTSVQRRVYVSNDSTPPVLALVGDAEVTVNIGGTYTDPGASATDNEDPGPVITALIQVQGLDAIDTSKTGEYTVTYDVTDTSGNKATQITRKVIVAEVSDPFTAWVATTNLASLDVTKQDLLADPDHDRVPNLLEYAIGGNPTSPDRKSSLPEATADGASLSVTFLRVKSSVDNTLTYKVELARKLKNGTWNEADVTVTVDADQTGVPADYERVTATATTPIANETQGRQFIRITVEKP